MRSMSRLRSIGLGLIFAGAALGSLAASPAHQLLKLGDATVSIEWDSSWQVGQTGTDAPPNSAEFHAKDPSQLQVMLSAHMPPDGAGVDEAMRSMVDGQAKDLLPQAVEKELPVEAFKNGDTHGYQVCATDRAPKPGEYKYICQGMAATGNWVVGYTVLYNDPGKAQAKKAVKVLQAMAISSDA